MPNSLLVTAIRWIKPPAAMKRGVQAGSVPLPPAVSRVASGEVKGRISMALLLHKKRRHVQFLFLVVTPLSVVFFVELGMQSFY